MKEEIYVIYDYFKETGDYGLDNVAFRDKDKAIEYIESKLNKEEIEKNRNAKKRNIQKWYEFFSKRVIYYIKVVDLV